MFARFENHLEVKFSACAHISVHTTFLNEAEKCFYWHIYVVVWRICVAVPF